MMMMLAYAIATDETTAKAPTIIRCVYIHQSNIQQKVELCDEAIS